MKKVVFLLFLLTPFLVAQAQEPAACNPAALSKKDLYQAEQWLKIMEDLWAVGDYPLLRYYCHKTLDFYPGTSYAEQAKKFLKKSRNPSKNRRRKFIRDNPGLFPGF